MDKKRKSGVPHRSGRRSFLGNQHTSNDDTEQTTVAAKKLKNADSQLEVKIHPLLTYVIVQWSVFVTLQQRVVCAKCNKKVEFAKSVEKGLGFQLQIICNCTRDHDGSAGLIEVEGVEEMFRRSVEQYGVMYEYYIGDGDSKTFKRLEESEPYGERLKASKEHRTAVRNARILQNDAYEDQEGVVYEAGMDM
ncbi:hypothetical protein JTB14_021747 [Gonioctena quinquepunctata]|nr:hypothetical protein JTB14_021747 [Gonioctena quinquepunctata]